MKIKNNNLLIFERKKITGTTISDLAGLNKFKPRGDAMLSILGYVSEPFDPFYTARGELAEKFAKQSLIKRGYHPVTYDKFECHFDNFPDNHNFGGLIDIDLPDINTLYEIKSKNIKDYDKIVKYGDKCQEEQAMHYAWLKNYPEAHIMWIFFDDISEAEIRAGKSLSSLKNLKMFEKTLPIDFKYQDELHSNALSYYNTVLSTGIIPLEDISDKYLKLLNLGGGHDDKK